jgi:transposase-like protein
MTLIISRWSLPKYSARYPRMPEAAGAARLSAPWRKSTGFVATSTRIPAGTTITSPPSRPAAHHVASRGQHLFPRAVVSEVTRRHDITPQHLFAWRKAARAGRLSLPAEQAPMFVLVVPAIREANGPASIVVEIAGAVRIGFRDDPAFVPLV